jgi:exodeoxyribonuclease VIII
VNGNLAEKITPLAPGIYPDIPASDYHGELLRDYVSKSYLKRLDKCPAAAKVPQEDTPAMAFGRASHVFLLEGEDAFVKECAVIPSGINKRTNAGKEEWAAFEAANAGKSLISADDCLKLVEMRKSIQKHPFAPKLLAEGVSEQTVIWQDAATGLMCKCRPDRIPDGNKGLLVDLKTCTCAGEYEFCRDVVKYGYDIQAAFYLDGIKEATGNNFDAFCFIAIEKELPYRTETYMLDMDFIVRGQREYRRLLNIEAECRASGVWPNYEGSGDLITLFKPNYL